MSKNTAGEIPATGLPSRRRPTHPGVVLLELLLRSDDGRTSSAAV